MSGKTKPLDLCNPATLRAVAQRVGLAAKGKFSQNFLIDRAVLEAVVEALAPRSGDTVLEVGPGIGALTGELAAHAGRVVAVDIDEACVEATRITQRHVGNVEVVHADIMKTKLEELDLGQRWLAAGNLPYHLTGAILGFLFERDDPPAVASFLVQREVAARLAADSGDWSLATVAIRSVATVERIRDVAPQSFSPEPKVHSSVIRMKPVHEMSEDERAAVLALAKPVFQMRRKMLRHGLSHAVGDDETARKLLREAEIDESRRPGTLSLSEWRTLAVSVAGLKKDR